MTLRARVIYWDASAVLSALFQDAHSKQARAWMGDPHVQLLSSLALAETHAVIARMRRDRAVAPRLLENALDTLAGGQWRQLHDGPPAMALVTLAQTWPLRGADLWHLAVAKSLHAEFPELGLLTFDERLRKAAAGEDLAA